MLHGNIWWTCPDTSLYSGAVAGALEPIPLPLHARAACKVPNSVLPSPEQTG